MILEKSKKVRLSRAAEFSGMDLSIQFVVQIWYITVSNEPAFFATQITDLKWSEWGKKIFPKFLKYTTGHNLFSTSFKNDTPNHPVTMCIGIFHFKPRYLGKYPDFNVWWGGSHLTGLSHTAVQLLCYFHSEGCPVVQKKSKLSCLGREGHGMALSFSLISCRNDPFVTAGFLESLGIEK